MQRKVSVLPIIASFALLVGCDNTKTEPVASQPTPTQIVELKDYAYVDGATLLIESLSESGKIVRSTWLNPEGQVILESDWRHCRVPCLRPDAVRA